MLNYNLEVIDMALDEFVDAANRQGNLILN